MDMSVGGGWQVPRGFGVRSKSKKNRTFGSRVTQKQTTTALLNDRIAKTKSGRDTYTSRTKAVI